MTFVVTNAQMKAAEAAADRNGVSYFQLMYNAGCACADRISRIVPEKSKKIAVLCGKGNNGGDGYVIANRLTEMGYGAVCAVSSAPPKTDCAGHYYDICKENSVSIISEEIFLSEKSIYDVTVDSIYGTGFHGTLPENAAALLKKANKSPVRVAVDVPSGVNSDTGEFDEDCFLPTHTIIIAAIKQGLISPSCADILGEVSVADIGIGEGCYPEYEARVSDETLRHPFPPRKRSAHKGSCGRLMNIAGCLCYNGAAAMSTKAALRSGVGLCMLAAPRSVISMHASSMNEATYLPLPENGEGFAAEGAVDLISSKLTGMNAISVGCGMGNNETTRKITEFVIRNADCPIIIDADGINCLSGNIDILKERRAAAVLTPHPLEFSRISGIPVKDIQADRLGSAKRFAKEYGVILVLKGAFTVIAAPDGTAFVNPTGNPGLARGGSGDTLTGIIAAMLAGGIDPLTAAAGGVYCHGLAADILLKRLPMECMLPTDIISALPEVFRR